MANTTTTAQLVSLRDKFITALEALAAEGVTSYTIGEQTFTLKDTDSLLDQVQRLDKLIALKDNTLGAKGRNRITLKNFYG
jgi:hypothetical protein